MRVTFNVVHRQVTPHPHARTWPNDVTSSDGNNNFIRLVPLHDIVLRITTHRPIFLRAHKLKLSITDLIVAHLRVHIPTQSSRSKRTSRLVSTEQYYRRSVPKTAPTLDFIGPDRLPPAEPSHFGASPGLNHSLSNCLILVFVPG